MADEVNKYIEKRYERWLDYSKYHCSCAGIEDEATDVLNEVLCSLLQKPEKQLQSLYERKSGQYTELDYYILRMIKLNATSPTSPYQHKYRPLPVDANVDYSRLDIEDLPDEDYDRPGDVLEKTNQVREILCRLNLSEKARKVFEWRFFLNEKFRDWPGPETEKELFDLYYKAEKLIKEKLNGKTLF